MSFLLQKVFDFVRFCLLLYEMFQQCFNKAKINKQQYLTQKHKI